ncbi:MAG: FAD-dependent oxidoreductase [Cyanobacteria bacterium P01_D01_bin.14]
MPRRNTIRVAIVGCGIVGAMIAYELSQVPDLDIFVFEKDHPAEGSTGAALGVLMGVISHKVKGRTWRLRQASIDRYQTLIDELRSQTNCPISYNDQGILSLCFDAEQLPKWQSLQTTRTEQGYPLEIWSPAQLTERCPHISLAGVSAAIYSPQDGQVDPTELTAALVQAARQNGTTFHMGTEITGIVPISDGIARLSTAAADISADWVVLSGGIGTTALMGSSPAPISLIPVFGKALRIKVTEPLGDASFQPVINGHDVHLVPHGEQVYSIGATVEFPAIPETVSLSTFQPDPALFEQMQRTAVGYCPALSEAQTVNTWFNLRPRPQGQPAPIIQPLAGFQNVMLATGHYRNGVLLAPATAQQVKARILEGLGLD